MKLYVLLFSNGNWEEMEIFDNEAVALMNLELLRFKGDARIEIFEKDGISYTPTYKFLE